MIIKRLLLFFFTTVLACGMAACDKKSKTTLLPLPGSGGSGGSGGTIYAAGYYHNGANNVACIWNISESTPTRTDLETADSRALGAAASGDAAYVVGDRSGQACVWNAATNTRTDLPGATPSHARGCVIIGSDLWVSGNTNFDPYGAGTMMGTLWRVPLGGGAVSQYDMAAAGNCLAQNVISYDGDLYIAGISTGNHNCYWQIDVATPATPTLVEIDSGSAGLVFDMAFYGDSLYLANTSTGGTAQATYYDYTGSDTSPINLLPVAESCAMGIINADGVIYIAGFEAGTACYWKKSSGGSFAQVHLSGADDSSATSAQMIDRDLYFAGYNTGTVTGSFPSFVVSAATACVWKKTYNGTTTRVDLTRSTTGEAQAQSVYRIQ